MIYCDALHLRKKDDWEQSRLIAYLIAQVNSKKRLSPENIIKFPWEEEKAKEKIRQKTKPLSLDELDEIKKQAKEREEKLKKQGII